MDSSKMAKSLHFGRRLNSWCCGAVKNNLELNTLKMAVDVRAHPSAPLTISSTTVSAMETLKFLGATISQKQETNIYSIHTFACK